MILRTSKLYSIIFAIVILLQLYLTSFKINLFIQILVLIYFMNNNNSKVNQSFLKYISPIIYIFLIGFLGTFINLFFLINIVKDIFHFIKPITGIFIGYLIFKKINNFKSFIQTVVITGFISSIIHFIIIFFFSNADTFNGLREFSKDNFLELFALFFLGYYKQFKKEELFINRKNYLIIFTVLLISCIGYLSRTMFVVSIILFLSIYGYTVITKKTLKFLGLLTLLILVFYAYLFSIKLERDSFLYKLKIAPAELTKTHIDRENHADLWDHWRGYEAKRAFALMEENPTSFLIGNGYGSLVNLKFYAPLTGNIEDKGLKYISELHNGYPYLLYKTGFIGFFMYLFFLFKNYIKIYKKRDFITVFISAIGLIFLFTTLTITGFYNPRDVMIFILGGLIYYDSKTINSEYL